jgi:hypothetical protein
VRWAGRIYGSGLTHGLRWRRPRVDHGVWGSAPFQSLYEPAPGWLAALTQVPEWHLMIATMAGIATLSIVWSPLRFALPMLVVAALPPVAHACLSAARARFPDGPHRWPARFARRLLTFVLHLMQPLARLRGRLNEGLTPWRRHGALRPAPLWPVTTSLWRERWLAQDEQLKVVETILRALGAGVVRGGRHDRWDLEVRGGILGAARLLMGVEDHPRGQQLVRLRWWPQIPERGPILTLAFAALTVGAAQAHAWVAAAILGCGALLPALHVIEQCMAAMTTIGQAVEHMRRGGS